MKLTFRVYPTAFISAASDEAQRFALWKVIYPSKDYKEAFTPEVLRQHARTPEIRKLIDKRFPTP